MIPLWMINLMSIDRTGQNTDREFFVQPRITVQTFPRHWPMNINTEL